MDAGTAVRGNSDTAGETPPADRRAVPSDNKPPRATVRPRGSRRDGFHSLVVDSPDAAPPSSPHEPPWCLADLTLDQLVEMATEGREDYDLASFYYAPATSVDAARYRQQVFADLDGPSLAGGFNAFAAAMTTMRKQLAQARKVRHRYQKQAWFLDATETYVVAVTALQQTVSTSDVQARALLGLRDYLARYVDSPPFRTLNVDVHRVRAALANVTYALTISGLTIQVRPFADETDYGEEIARFFARFRQGDVDDYRFQTAGWPEMNHVEEQIVDRVALLHRDEFMALDRFCRDHSQFLDEVVGRVDREAQFYLGYLELIRGLREAGLPFCYPTLSGTSKEVHVEETFDIVLAARRKTDGASIVRNAFSLTDPERVIVVTGPNQGGKTTFARTVGQLHYLARLGCPVPGSAARLYLCDEVFTHFERGENLTDLRGKLEDDLIRIHDILGRASGRSLVIMNEIFTSTTQRDALLLGTAILEQLSQMDTLSVCVTFIDELAEVNDKTVSMVAGVSPDDPTVRTYRIERRPADGRAYAVVLAEKYGLSYEQIKKRIVR